MARTPVPPGAHAGRSAFRYSPTSHPVPPGAQRGALACGRAVLTDWSIDGHRAVIAADDDAEYLVVATSGDRTVFTFGP